MDKNLISSDVLTPLDCSRYHQVCFAGNVPVEVQEHVELLGQYGFEGIARLEENYIGVYQFVSARENCEPCYRLSGAFTIVKGIVVPVKRHYRDEPSDHLIAIYKGKRTLVGWPDLK